ncbi:hypothetical protein H4219_003940 [Mycoemilia scoparia]|uniref:Uncharacterized protein n=1 Tax=Mycoemilia scoparia TaxID=417184 RepID=A0A9W8A1D1_9FUNG|nr:hypothetical protein H4219_003940 [Mycoemilia scoparia]
MVLGKFVLSVAATVAFTASLGGNVAAFPTNNSCHNPSGHGRCDNDKPFIVFGDSLSDIGSKLAIFGEQSYWEGHYSNGPVWNEYTAYLLNRPLINYSIGGASSSNSALVNGTKNGQYIPSLLDQIDYFFKNSTNAAGSGNNINTKESIVTLEIGGNNLFTPFDSSPEYVIASKDKLVEGLAQDIAKGLQKVYDAGYRQILVWDVYPVYNAPALVDDPKNKAIMKGIFDNANVKIKNVVDEFVSKNKESSKHIKLFNSNNLFNLIVKPEVLSALNITDIKTPCVSGNHNMDSPDYKICDNGYQHLSYDPIHPAARTHHILGVLAAEFIKNPEKKFVANDLIHAAKKYKINEATAEDNILSRDGVHNVPPYPSKSD